VKALDHKIGAGNIVRRTRTDRVVPNWTETLRSTTPGRRDGFHWNKPPVAATGGDPDHLKVFANADAAETWFEENDPRRRFWVWGPGV